MVKKKPQQKVVKLKVYKMEKEKLEKELKEKYGDRLVERKNKSWL